MLRCRGRVIRVLVHNTLDYCHRPAPQERSAAGAQEARRYQHLMPCQVRLAPICHRCSTNCIYVRTERAAQSPSGLATSDPKYVYFWFAGYTQMQSSKQAVGQSYHTHTWYEHCYILYLVLVLQFSDFMFRASKIHTWYLVLYTTTCDAWY